MDVWMVDWRRDADYRRPIWMTVEVQTLQIEYGNLVIEINV
jgi:hypothetical protein